MPNPSRTKRASSSDDVLATVAFLAQEGVKTVALHPQQKAAIDNRYTKSDYTPPEIAFWKGGNYGVGAATGLEGATNPERGGLCDADLDCDESRAIAPDFFPPTPAIFGRASSRSSHREYRVKTSFFHKFIDPIDGTTILELRASAGHQTVMPGSLHQDTGELIEWEPKTFRPIFTFPEADEDVLYAAGAKTAIATLVARHLWHDGSRNDVTMALAGALFFLKWTEDEAVALIESVARYKDDDDKTRVLAVRSTFRKGERGERIKGAPTLAKESADAATVIAKIQEWAGSPTVGVIAEYNGRYAQVNMRGKFRVAHTDVPPGEIPIFSGKEDFLNLNDSDRITIEGKSVPKARLWLASPSHRQYRKADFLPGVEADPDGTLNLWTGWTVEAEEGDCSAWLELMRDVICGGDAQMNRWCLCWFAHLLRSPLEIARTSLAIIGPQGAGKSLLLSYFGRILGISSFIVVTDPEQIYGKFNAHLGSCLLLHSAEALFAGDKKHRGIIKSMITDEYRMFEPKGIDAIQVRNHVRLVLTSNNLNPAPVEHDDRRFTVIDMEGRMVSADLLKRVLAELNAGGPAALLHYLTKEFDYDAAVPQKNLQTEAHETLKQLNAEPVEAWWRRRLELGEILSDDLTWAQRPKGNEGAPWPPVVSATALYTDFLISHEGQRHSITQAAFAKQLKDMLVGHTLNRGDVRFDNPWLAELSAHPKIRALNVKQTSITNMPSLAECRGAFEVYVRHAIKWPEDETLERLPHERWKPQR